MVRDAETGMLHYQNIAHNNKSKSMSQSMVNHNKKSFKQKEPDYIGLQKMQRNTFFKRYLLDADEGGFP